MEIKKSAIAGTVESSDLMVRVEPGEGRVELTLESAVKERFGDQIRQSVESVLQELGVSSVKMFIDDRGALDCVIRARVETAVRRAAEEV